MRIFQNSGLYPSYVPKLRRLTAGLSGFADLRTAFLSDRFGATHFLLPVLNGHEEAFFTNCDDAVLQKAWAKEHGISPKSSMEDILLSQIEEHRTEVFYNLAPVHYDSKFVKRLPSCVKKSIAWRAAPSSGADFSAYDLMLSNLPSLITGWKKQGINAEYFSPAYDPNMSEFANNQDRPIDVLFIGAYSRHHMQRANTLRAVAELSSDYKIQYCLDRSRITRLAETFLGSIPPLKSYRLPRSIVAVSNAPVFGLDMYDLIGKSKIVLNGSIDMAGNERGNMRCFEAMGCGALLISDEGVYPQGMVAGDTMLNYQGSDVVDIISSALSDWNSVSAIAKAGNKMIEEQYSKQNQWDRFKSFITV